MTLKKLCAAAALACATLPAAHAAGSFDALSVPTETYLGVYATPIFLDTVSFWLSGPSTVFADSAVFSATGFYGLLDSANALIGGPVALGDSATYSDLAAGSYTFVFGGFKSAGAAVSAVSLSANAVAVVPEPETYAMLLAGLGMVMMMVGRRYS